MTLRDPYGSMGALSTQLDRADLLYIDFLHFCTFHFPNVSLEIKICFVFVLGSDNEIEIDDSNKNKNFCFESFRASVDEHLHRPSVYIHAQRRAECSCAHCDLSK